MKLQAHHSCHNFPFIGMMLNSNTLSKWLNFYTLNKWLNFNTLNKWQAAYITSNKMNDAEMHIKETSGNSIRS